MKTLKLSILAATMLVAGITTAKAQTADEIMEKRSAAAGSTNWDKVKTLKLSGVIKQQGMEIPMSQTIVMDKASRMDITVMGMTGYQIVSGNEGWSYMPFMGSDKIDTLKPEVVKAMKEQFDVKGRQKLDYKSKGGKAELDGKDTINNVMCYKVKVTDKDGIATTYFIDSKTFYTLRTESVVKSEEGAEEERSIVYSDYQKQSESGIVMPMAINAGGAEIIFKSVEVNQPVDDKIFKPGKP